MREWHESMSDEEFDETMDYLYEKYKAEKAKRIFDGRHPCPDVDWNAELDQLVKEGA